MSRKRDRAAGCALLLVFLLIECAVGFAIGYTVASNLWAFLDRGGWIADDAGNGLIAIFTGMAAAAVPVLLIDHLCRKLTGESAIELFGSLPSI